MRAREAWFHFRPGLSLTTSRESNSRSLGTLAIWQRQSHIFTLSPYWKPISMTAMATKCLSVNSFGSSTPRANTWSNSIKRSDRCCLLERLISKIKWVSLSNRSRAIKWISSPTVKTRTTIMCSLVWRRSEILSFRWLIKTDPCAKTIRIIWSICGGRKKSSALSMCRNKFQLSFGRNTWVVSPWSTYVTKQSNSGSKESKIRQPKM